MGWEDASRRMESVLESRSAVCVCVCVGVWVKGCVEVDSTVQG